MKKIVLLTMLLLGFSCNHNKVKKPENLIKEEKMIDILYELSVFYANKGVNVNLIRDNKLTIEDFIYDKFEIDSIQFAQSTAYYSYFPDKNLNMYNAVKDRLEVTRDRLKKEDEARRKKRDSLL